MSVVPTHGTQPRPTPAQPLPRPCPGQSLTHQCRPALPRLNTAPPRPLPSPYMPSPLRPSPPLASGLPCPRPLAPGPAQPKPCGPRPTPSPPALAHRQFITNTARNWFSNFACCWQSMHSVVKHSGQDRMASELCDLRWQRGGGAGGGTGAEQVRTSAAGGPPPGQPATYRRPAGMHAAVQHLELQAIEGINRQQLLPAAASSHRACAHPCTHRRIFCTHASSRSSASAS